jgi:hypothetical protein
VADFVGLWAESGGDLMSKFNVGDWVMVRKPAHFDELPGWLQSKLNLLVIGSVRKIVAVDFYELEESKKVFDYKLDHINYTKFSEDSLEPFYPDQPDPTWVPEGYTVIPIAVPDEMREAIGEGNALVWSQCNVGERYLSSAYNRVKIRQTRTDDFLNVIVPTTTPAEQYREPTQADVGKMTEVRDDSRDQWVERKLLAVIDDDSMSHRFICRISEGNPLHLCWRYAQIKIEEVK